MDKTFLSVKDLAVKMNVSEKTIYRMIGDNRIPYGIKIGGQWRFNAEKIEKWAKQVSSSAEPDELTENMTISDTLSDNTITYKICGTNRDEVLDQLLAILNRFTDQQTGYIKRNILYKESIISSSINGISVMVSDYDPEIDIPGSVFAVAYLDSPLDFKGIDSIKTEIVILIVPAGKTQQHILTTRLRGLMSSAEFVSGLKSEPNRTDLINLFRTCENEIFQSPEKKK